MPSLRRAPRTDFLRTPQGVPPPPCRRAHPATSRGFWATPLTCRSGSFRPPTRRRCRRRARADWACKFPRKAWGKALSRRGRLSRRCFRRTPCGAPDCPEKVFLCPLFAVLKRRQNGGTPIKICPRDSPCAACGWRADPPRDTSKARARTPSRGSPATCKSAFPPRCG